MPRSGIAGSYGGFIPCFLRNLHTVFHSGLSIYIPTNSARVFPFLHTPSAFVCRLFDDGYSDQCDMISHFSFDLHFSNNEQYWPCVSHLFVFLEKCLFRSFSHFLIGLFVFLGLNCMSCLYILETNPLSIVSFAIIFSPSEGDSLLIVSFAVPKLLSLIRSHLFTFVINSNTLGGGSQRILLWFMSLSVLPVFPWVL